MSRYLLRRIAVGTVFFVVAASTRAWSDVEEKLSLVQVARAAAEISVVRLTSARPAVFQFDGEVHPCGFVYEAEVLGCASTSTGLRAEREATPASTVDPRLALEERTLDPCISHARQRDADDEQTQRRGVRARVPADGRQHLHAAERVERPAYHRVV